MFQPSEKVKGGRRWNVGWAGDFFVSWFLGNALFRLFALCLFVCLFVCLLRAHSRLHTTVSRRSRVFAVLCIHCSFLPPWRPASSVNIGAFLMLPATRLHFSSSSFKLSYYSVSLPREQKVTQSRYSRLL